MAQPVTAVKDWRGNEYPLMATINYEWELNGNQTIDATILCNRVNEKFIDDIAEKWSVIDHYGNEHKILILNRQGQGEKRYVKIKAIPIFIHTLQNMRIYERVDKHMTAQEAFTRIFDGTGFTFVLVDSFDAVEWEGFGEGESLMDTFQRALERYGAEFRIIKNQVELRKLIGRDLQIQYRHRLNASNITLENDASAMWTYVKGYGDYGDGEGGEDWQDAKLVKEYTSPLAKIPGIGKLDAPPLKNGNIKTETKMMEELKRIVDESLKISVSADIHDLRRNGYPIAQPEVGDRVYMADERINFNEQVRIVQLQVMVDWKHNVRDISATFGTPGLSRRYQARLNSTMNAVTDLLDGKIKLPAASVYDDAMRNAVQAIQNAETELQFPVQGGIIAVDKNDPNKQVWFNSAGLMVSKTGGATAEAAITGEGVVAEKIIGRSIIGVNLTSADNTGFFHVTGPYAQFYDMLTRRTLDMSPTGIYGYEPNNPRPIFQADRSLVTSAALGTAVANVYLGAQSGFEARVVDMSQLPGSGLVDDYNYQPLRASGVYANFWNINTAATLGTPVNLYARPLTTGELRVTLNGTTDIYRDVRARDVFANAIRNNGLFGDSEHIHMRMPGELRVVDGSSLDSYRPVRASGFLGTYLDLDAVGNPQATHIYVRPAGDPGELRVTVRGTTDVYRPVRAREFLPPSSTRETKKDIEVYSDNALDILRGMDVYAFRYNADATDTKKMLGVMLDEAPDIIQSEGRDTIEMYSSIGFLMKAVKDGADEMDAQKSEIDDLKRRIEQLEGATT